MKVVKIILIILGIVILIGVVVGLIAPKDFEMNRSITIEANQEKVYKHISSLKAMDTWSPWNRLDPDMKKEFKGEDGAIGSKSTWDGKDSVGAGHQTLTANRMDSVATKLVFTRPWESEADVYITTAEVEGGTEVTWGFKTHFAFPMNLFLLMNDMDSELGKDYDEGLKLLKDIVESEFDTKGYEVSMIERPAMTYVLVRDVISIDNEVIQGFFAKNFGAIMGSLAKKKINPTGPPTGIYWNYDFEAGTTDMAAAIPVAEGTTVKGFDVITIPASKALFAPYHGDYTKMEECHFMLNEFLGHENLELNEVVIEEYVTDPGSEPNPENWLTNILYLVK